MVAIGREQRELRDRKRRGLARLHRIGRVLGLRLGLEDLDEGLDAARLGDPLLALGVVGGEEMDRGRRLLAGDLHVRLQGRDERVHAILVQKGVLVVLADGEGERPEGVGLGLARAALEQCDQVRRLQANERARAR